MLVHSERLGELDVEDDKVLTFPEGLLGFPADTRFVMIAIEDTDVYWWLQSTDDPALAFLAVIPWQFFPEYEPEIDEVTENMLQLTDPSQAIVLCLVTVRPEADNAITANLLGPLIVNSHTRLGRQIVLSDTGYPVRAALVGG